MLNARTWPVLLAVALASGGCADAGVHDPTNIHFDTVTVVGVADGSDVETFGEIRAIEPAPDGGFFVLDAQDRSIAWFSHDGSYRGGVSARGEGPGELSFPTDIAFTASQNLVVLDPSNTRLSWFQAVDTGFAYLDYRRNELRGSQICALGDRLFLNGPRDGTAIQEIGEGEEPIGSFGAPIVTPGLESLGAARTLAESMIPVGPIVCLSEPDLVVIVGASAPYIRAYTLDGVPTWETELVDFRPVQLEVTERGGVRQATNPENGTHWAVSASRWDASLLLVQYELRTDARLPDGALDHELESRFIDLETGREVYQSRDFPLIAATEGPYAYEQRDLPFPQVAVLRRR